MNIATTSSGKIFLNIIILFCIIFTGNIYSQRFSTPDGEITIRKEVINTNGITIRVVSTQNSIYISKYILSLDWNTNKSLYMVPPGRRIVDFNFNAAETGDKRTLYLLLDDGQVYSFILNIKTQEFEGNKTVIPSPGATGGSYRKIIVSKFIWVYYATRLYINRNDNNGWKTDTNGFKGSTLNDVAFDLQQNLYAATNRGLFFKQDTAAKWTRITSFDTTISCSSIFFQRNGNLFTGTNNKGPFYSTNNGTNWTRDTSGGLATLNIFRFGDDALGNVYSLCSVAGVYRLYRQINLTSPWERLDTNLRNSINAAPRLYDAGGDSSLEIATTYGNYTSRDNGNTFKSSYNGIMSEDIYGIKFLSDYSIVASTSFGIFIQDGPTSPWKKTYPTTGFATSRTLKMDKSEYIYTQEPTSGSGQTHQPNTLISTDKGQNWSIDSTGISNVPTGTTVFYVDDNGGQHYGSGSTNITPVRVYSHSISSPWALDTVGTNFQVPKTGQFEIFSTFGNDSKSLYFSAFMLVGQTYPNSYIFKRDISSETWGLDTIGLNNTPIISLTSDKNGDIAAGSLSNGSISSIFIKNNDTWQSIKVPPAATSDVRYMAYDTSGNLYVAFGPYYSGSYRGVYLTDDKGISWQYAGLDSVTVRGISGNGDSMYAFSNRGVYKLNGSVLKVPVLVLSLKNIDFQKVTANTYKDSAVSIQNTGNDTLRVTNITSSNAAFVALNKNFIVAPNSSYNLTIRFTPTGNTVLKATIKVVSNAYPDSILVTGEGIGYKYPKMILSTNTIDFGIVQGGKHKDTIFVVKNTGDDTLKVTNIRSNNTSYQPLSTVLTLAPGDSSSVTLRFTPNKNGVISTSLRISGNINTDTINVTGIGENVAVPKIQLSYKDIAFGKINLSTPKDTIVQITNIGDDTLRITNITTTSPNFLVIKKPAIIAPGITDTISIRFLPLSAGPLNGYIIISGNAGLDSISVTGMGVKTSVDDNFFSGLNVEVFPNPANNEVNIKFTLPFDCYASFKLFNTLSNELSQLSESYYFKGENIFTSQLNNLSEGIYYIKMTIDGYSSMKKIIIIR